jgi:uncharacterized protein
MWDGIPLGARAISGEAHLHPLTLEPAHDTSSASRLFLAGRAAPFRDALRYVACAMLLVRTYLEKSEIHGFGVFAKEPVKKGTPVWRFHEKLDIKFTPEEFDALPPSAKEELEWHMYEPDEGGPYYYEATMGKYMNHSREPNVDFSAVGVGTATRDIAAGEELTCDYRHFMAVHDHIPYI